MIQQAISYPAIKTPSKAPTVKLDHVSFEDQDVPNVVDVLDFKGLRVHSMAVTSDEKW